MNAAHKMLPKEELGNLVVVPFSISVQGKALHLCLNVQKITEVVDNLNFSPLPSSYHPFVGVYDHRVGPVPILNISQLFSSLADEGLVNQLKPIPKPCPRQRIVFSHLHNYMIGLLVDHTKRIEAVRNTDVLPVPTPITKKSSNFFNGIIRSGNELMYMLDIENILNDYMGSLSSSLADNYDLSNKLNLTGRQILVVEDSPLFRKLIEQILVPMGAQVDFADNGQIGLDKVLSQPDRYDAIFTDIEMPLMNGIEMVRKIKLAKVYRGKILFNSSISNPSLIEAIQSENLGEYIIKFNQEIITTKLTELFSKS